MAVHESPPAKQKPLRQRRGGDDLEKGGEHSYSEKRSIKRRRGRGWRMAGLLFFVTFALVIFYRRKCPQLKSRQKHLAPIARILSFHKNERYLLGDWLGYHCNLIGCENIVVVDHSSDDPYCLSLLDHYARRGLAVVPFQGSFKDKATALSAAMRASSNTAELLIPIDIDEFIVLEENGNLSIDRSRILASFRSLLFSTDYRKYKFNSRVADCPDSEVVKRPALAATHFSPPRTTSMGKTFFRANQFISTDQGNHFGRVRHDNNTNEDIMLKPRNFHRFFQHTNLTLLHFSMPDFQTWHAKLAQRAKAYGFTMKTNCNAVRKGQRYCRSFQTLRAGTAPLHEARTEYRAVCSAIANQQNMYNPQGGGPSSTATTHYTALADFLRSLSSAASSQQATSPLSFGEGLNPHPPPLPPPPT